METLEKFCLDLDQDDRMSSFDLTKGFRHFRLHPAVRNWSICSFQGRYYRCISQQFGWNFSPAYFIQLMIPTVRYARQVLKLKICPYMDDFLLASRSIKELVKMRYKIGRVFKRMGVARNISKVH